MFSAFYLVALGKIKQGIANHSFIIFGLVVLSVAVKSQPNCLLFYVVNILNSPWNLSTLFIWQFFSLLLKIHWQSSFQHVQCLVFAPNGHLAFRTAFKVNHFNKLFLLQWSFTQIGIGPTDHPAACFIVIPQIGPIFTICFQFIELLFLDQHRVPLISLVAFEAAYACANLCSVEKAGDFCWLWPSHLYIYHPWPAL